jgi:hypothetical protein
VRKLCLCLLLPTGSGTGVLVMRLPTLSRVVQGMQVWESKYSSSGVQLVWVVYSSPTSSSRKPRASPSNKSMNFTTMASSPGSQLTGSLNPTIGPRNAGRVRLRTLRGPPKGGQQVNLWTPRSMRLMARRSMILQKSKHGVYIPCNINLSLYIHHYLRVEFGILYFLGLNWTVRKVIY